jgi:hypothetical protein
VFQRLTGRSFLNLDRVDNGDDMETNEKTFRYTYVLKNLGVLYLMFLFSCIVGGLFIGQKEFMFSFLPIMLGFGVVVFLIPYYTSRVNVSDLEISTKTLLGTKSLQWAEISHFSARGSSTRLHHYDGDIVLSIGSRLDGYAEIFELLHQKRPDLFNIDKYKSFSHSKYTVVAWLVFGFFLAGLGVAGYVRGIDLSTAFKIGLSVFFVPALINWYYSPRSLILGTNNLDISYLRKTVSIPIDAIVDISLGRQQQINSVLVLLKNRGTLNLSGYDQSPIVMYYVLKRWLQTYGIGTQTTPT